MELIDTPNPNAKKILSEITEDALSEDLNKIKGVSSVFFGPGFITITKEENIEWELINQDIINIFDKL
ncbi:MAG: NifU N-terminal domain-containing protein [Actinomycetota bacterium]|nr:NifU N-terminal domain-containing protein [Actinomycetota bacterium]